MGTMSPKNMTTLSQKMAMYMKSMCLANSEP